MGALDHLSHMFNCSCSGRRRRINKLKQFQTVEMRVKIDCEGCERKVRRSLEGMKGVTSVEVEPSKSKVTVVGYVNPTRVVARLAFRTGKRVEIWPYVPYDLVSQPYSQGVYDRKAPPGYVRPPAPAYSSHPNLMFSQSHGLARATSTEVRYTTAFSDDNTAACSIM